MYVCVYGHLKDRVSFKGQGACSVEDHWGKNTEQNKQKTKVTSKFFRCKLFFYRQEIWENLKFRKIFKWASPVGSVLLHLALQPVLRRLAVPSKALLCYHNAFWPVNKKEREIEGRWRKNVGKNDHFHTRVSKYSREGLTPIYRTLLALCSRL